MNARLAAVAIVLAVLVGGCSNPSDPEWAPDYRYPLELGRSWEYTRVFTVEPSDSLSAVPSDTAYCYCTAEVVRLDTLSMRVDAYVLRETGVEDTVASWDLETFYRNDSDGLYMLAYEPGASLVNPKPQGRAQILFKGMYFSSVREIASHVVGIAECMGERPDSLIYEDPPVRALKYPLRVGSSWNYRQTGNPWRIDKEVTGTEQVDVPAGSFDCFVVKWSIDISDDGEWDNEIEFIDYIATEGLIRRWLAFSDMIAIGPEGDTLGVCHSSDDSQLTSMSPD